MAGVTQRRRMSRAQVERTPEREADPLDVSLWQRDWRAGVLPSDPPAQNAALFTREMIDRALERYDPTERAMLMTASWPTPERPPPLPPEAVAAILRMEGSRMYPARPEDTRGLNPGTIMYRGQVYDRVPLDTARARDRDLKYFADERGRAWSEELARYGSQRVSDDKVDAPGPWGDPVLDGWRAEGIRRRAVERTGRILVAWLIGRWRR